MAGGDLGDYAGLGASLSDKEVGRGSDKHIHERMNYNREGIKGRIFGAAGGIVLLGTGMLVLADVLSPILGISLFLVAAFLTVTLTVLFARKRDKLRNAQLEEFRTSKGE